MTSIFDTTGKQTAVTIIEAGPCVVTQKKTVETGRFTMLFFKLHLAIRKKKHTLKSKPGISLPKLKRLQKKS